MQTCGIENEEIYYVVEEYHIVNKEVLDIISCLIVSGEVMGLYQTEELESLCSPLKDQMSQHNFDGTPTTFFKQSKSCLCSSLTLINNFCLENMKISSSFLYIRNLV